MSSIFNKIVFSIISMFLLASATWAVVPQIPAAPSDYVTDLAGIISNDVEMSLNGYLRELEQKTTAQVVVLTILSLEGESIEDVSLKTAHDRWRLGREDRDNGALILIASEDQQYRLEIGYGLEGILPDSLVGSIGRDYMVPNFRIGDYSKGVYAATLAVINEIASNEGVEITGMPRIERHGYPAGSRKGGGILGFIFSILFIIAAMILFIRHPRLFLLLLLTSSLGGRRSGWSGGGGFGSGGGSFGGGLGGGFGGGGASGRW